jgi:hypothetical protein
MTKTCTLILAAGFALVGCSDDPAGSTASLRLVPDSVAIKVGERTYLQVQIAGAPVTSMIRFTALNPAIAAVDSLGAVTGVAPGTARVVGELEHTSHAADTVLVTVAPAPTCVLVLQVVPSNPTLLVGDTVRFHTYGCQSGEIEARYLSDKPQIAAVTEDGLATGVSPGTAIITAIARADENVRMAVAITVKPRPAP